MRRNAIPTICSATGWLSTSKNPIFPIMRNPFPRPPHAERAAFIICRISVYTADDVETYLSLLQSVPDYVQGLLSYESEKSAAGLFMEKEDAKKSAQQCREILTKEALSSGTHFLQTTFSSRLASLLQKGLLTAKQQSQYEAQNQSLLSKSVLPAWQLLADGWNSFPTPDARGEDFPRSLTAAILYLARQGIHRFLPFHGSALFAPSKTVSENLQRDEADVDHLSGADRRYA